MPRDYKMNNGGILPRLVLFCVLFTAKAIQNSLQYQIVQQQGPYFISLR